MEEIIGLIPAAGYASRIAPIPCSKEIFPIEIAHTKEGRNHQTKVISHYLLESMKVANVKKTYMIIRDGKWDIPAYYQKIEDLNIDIAYLVTGATLGVPYTLDCAYPFVRDKKIVFGFPDILFKPKLAFKKLIGKQEQTSADITLGLFEANNPQKLDMVDFGKNGDVKKIEIKPRSTYLKHTWIMAVWSPRFTQFMHESLSDGKTLSDPKREIHIGEIVQMGIDEGLKVNSIDFSNGLYVDIGTKDDLKKVMEMSSFNSGDELSEKE